MTLSSDALITLLILAGAVVLFLSNRLRPDMIALLVLISLGASGVLTPEEAFNGFSRSAVITIVAIFVLAHGLTVTGASERVGQGLVRLAGTSGTRLVVLVMVSGAFLSLFMNNIAAASVLLPAATVAARRSGINPSRLLMPLAFATIMGGMATLFTTTNILMSGLLREQGLPGFGVLDFAPVGIPVVIVGVLYMTVLGRKLLPERVLTEDFGEPAAGNDDLAELYRLEERMFRVRIPPGSYLDEKPLVHSTFREQYNLNVVAVERDGRTVLAPPPDMVMHVGDIVTLEGSLEEFRQKDIEPYLEILSRSDLSERDLESPEVVVTEVVLSPRSGLVDRTLKEVNFREKFGFTVLAIWRAGRPIRRGLTMLPLQFGDALLLQGPRERVHLLSREQDLILLGEELRSAMFTRPGKVWMAAAIMLVTVFVAAANILPTAEAMLGGSLVMILAGCVTADEGYNAIDWKSVVLVGGMLPMGLALTKTGVAAFLGEQMVTLVGHYGPWYLLAGLFILAVLLVQVITGPAVSAMLGPLAIVSAQQIGANPTTVALGVALATSMAFLTPLGHPVNILVMGSGGYSFGDYFKVGLPLVLLLGVVILGLLPLIWPL